MNSYLLDSDVIIEYFKHDPKTVELVDGLGPKIKLWISVLSLIEVKSGVKTEVKKDIDRFFNYAKIVPVSLPIGELATEYIRSWKKKGKILYLVDAVLASSCVFHDLILVTYNKRDYPMKELRML